MQLLDAPIEDLDPRVSFLAQGEEEEEEYEVEEEEDEDEDDI